MWFRPLWRLKQLFNKGFYLLLSHKTPATRGHPLRKELCLVGKTMVTWSWWTLEVILVLPRKRIDRYLPTLKRTTVKETGTISEEPLILRGYVSFSGSIVNCHWLFFIRTCLDYVDTPLKKIPGTSRERYFKETANRVPGRISVINRRVEGQKRYLPCVCWNYLRETSFKRNKTISISWCSRHLFVQWLVSWIFLRVAKGCTLWLRRPGLYERLKMAVVERYPGAEGRVWDV